jgi:hypothetical protein
MATIQDVYRRQGTATRVLNTEIKKEIIRQNAVDTGRMKNVSKIVQLKWNEDTDSVSYYIDSTFYFHGIGLDGKKWAEGGVDVRRAKKWMGGTIPRNISDAFSKREKVVEQIDKLIEIIFEYRIDQQFQ